MTRRPLEIGLCTLVMTAAATGVHGQCTNDAGAGDVDENELCLLDDDVDTTNGGCNSSPPVFTVVPNLPVTFCGTASTYDVDTTGDGFPDTSIRDTDWYRISSAQLLLGDTDGNGVVRIISDVIGEPGLDLVTILITGDFDATCTASVEANVGCWDSTGGTPASNVVVIADNPGGVVVFVATGLCSGGAIVNGFECATGLNDYVVTIQIDPLFEDGTFASCGDPAQNPLLGPCNEANPGVGGCEDPACCKIVCGPGGFNPLCCQDVPLGWIQTCADTAVILGCAPEPGPPIRIATGPDELVDGFLAVAPDPYGSWSSDIFGGAGPGDPDWGDVFNPIDAGAGPREVSFSNGFFLFNALNAQRELLSNILDWQNTLSPDPSLERQIIGDGSLAFDDNLDGVFDRLESSFIVTGPGMDLTFDLTQQVESLGAGVATLTQTYAITNNSPAPVDFVLLRAVDHDMTWDAMSDIGDDSVGTDTNGLLLDRFVFLREVGLPGTAVSISSPQGNLYYGAKSGIDPDGAGPGPAMSAGTTSLQWDSFGVPIGWENYIAGVGADIDGASGAAPAGCAANCDGSIGLEISVSLAGKASTVITITHTYGAAQPSGPDPCGDPFAGGCFRANGTPGCDDAACCQLVCGSIPACCNVGWDVTCVQEAVAVCAGAPGCGDPLAGTCYGINDTPACSDAACCQLVCALNPLCCAAPWDISCFLTALANCDTHQVIFGFTPDDFGASNECTGGQTILTTQYVNTHSVVFGTAVDNFSPSVVVSGDHAACSGTCRSFGLPAATTDWWCQFRLGDGPGVPGAPAGVDSFTAEVCLTTAPKGTVVLEGYDIDLALVTTAVSTLVGAEALSLTAPPEVLISYVRVIASDLGQSVGLSVAWIDYPKAVMIEEVVFNPPEEFPAAGEPNFQAVGDFDGDGTTDTVAVIPDLDPGLVGSIQVFLNQGTDQSDVWQGFVANSPITVGRDPNAVAVGLFNLDAHLDLAVTNAADGTVSILFNQGLGDGSFLLVDTVAVGNGPTDVVAADFDSDTFTDLAVTLGGDETFVILVNDGLGNFTLLGVPEAAGIGLSPRAMVTGDFDDNKCPDVAGAGAGTVASGFGGKVFVALGQGDGTFLITLLDVGLDPRDIAVGDLDGDGLADLVVPNFADGTVSILVNGGAGSYLPQVTVQVGVQPESVEVVDLDADLANDLAVVAVDAVIGPAVQVLLGTGGGLGFDPPLAFSVDANPNTVVSTDLDGDLLPDLITVNQDPDQKTGGSVTALISVPQSAPCPWDCGGDNDGAVGIVDFLALLGQWTMVGTSCDFDSGGVGIVDFLELLANWGACP